MALHKQAVSVADFKRLSYSRAHRTPPKGKVNVFIFKEVEPLHILLVPYLSWLISRQRHGPARFAKSCQYQQYCVAKTVP